MRILWLTWKDRGHPQAGGAETISGEIIDRLVQDGHEVILLTALYPQAAADEQSSEGYRIIRVGGRYSVYMRARKYFKQHLADWPDLVIDEMNTIPFGAAFYTRKPTVLLTYQLARSVWFYQMPPPLSLLGYIAEPLYLRLLARAYPLVLTESKSTRQDLLAYGFIKEQVQIFRIGISLQPVKVLSEKSPNTVLSLGSIRPMKRTLDAVRAFEEARDSNDRLRLIVAGDASGEYAKAVTSYIQQSRHKESIELRGRVSNSERLRLMRSTALIVVTSVKEGWGLIVTEANSQGTPAIVYDTDGLRDSVRDGVTGALVPNGDYKAMGTAINRILDSPETYTQLRANAWEWSKEFTFEKSYQDFKKHLLDNNLLK